MRLKNTLAATHEIKYISDGLDGASVQLWMTEFTQYEQLAKLTFAF